MALMNSATARDNKFIRLISQRLISDPHFMCFCPNRGDRSEFISSFFEKQLPRWCRTQRVLVSDNKEVLAVMLEPGELNKHFWGESLFSSPRGERKRIRAYREIVGGLKDIIIPDYIDTRVLMLFGDSQKNPREILSIILEAKELAEKEDFVIFYTTLSKTLVPVLEHLEFKTGYERQFLTTQYLHTLMIYNI